MVLGRNRASRLAQGLGLAVATLTLFAVARAAVAEAAYTFATTPGRLPKTVVPLHYTIDLKPDLDSLVIAGSEVVEIEVLAPTDRVVLNAVNMTLDFASVDGENPADIALDATAETATLTFPRPFATGRHTLAIAFTARVNTFGRGLFMVDYPGADGRKRMIATTHG